MRLSGLVVPLGGFESSSSPSREPIRSCSGPVAPLGGFEGARLGPGNDRDGEGHGEPAVRHDWAFRVGSEARIGKQAKRADSGD